jgi:hypothetical protein
VRQSPTAAARSPAASRAIRNQEMPPCIANSH